MDNWSTTPPTPRPTSGSACYLAIRPGIIHATNSLNGRSSPWAERVGFDQTAGALTGMADLEGGGGPPRLSPILVVNDYIVSWLTAAGVAAALGRRAHEGGSWAVHVSLSFTADTALGHYQGVTDQVRMSVTPGRYRHVLLPRGAAQPGWVK